MGGGDDGKDEGEVRKETGPLTPGDAIVAAPHKQKCKITKLGTHSHTTLVAWGGQRRLDRRAPQYHIRV